MHKPDLFERTVSVLVRAFFDGTLAKSTCHACAVGNLVAAGLGGTVQRRTPGGLLDFDCDKSNTAWSRLFVTHAGRQEFYEVEQGDEEPLANIAATGYTVEELARIEYAFETHTEVPWWYYPITDEQVVIGDQYAGLMAVLEVLFEIHGVTEAARPESRERFNHPALLPA